MKLYAIVTSERLSRPARKGAEKELTVILSEGNRPVAEIVQRPGRLEMNLGDILERGAVIINGRRIPPARFKQKV